MTASGLARLFAALVVAATMTACTATNGSTESAGAYVDDSAITAKVKSAVLAEPGLHTLQIGVETYKGTVQLSGFVDSAQSRARAGALAAAVPGVRSVHNDLLIK